MKRFSSSFSARQSLGMPSRSLAHEGGDMGEAKTRKSRLPVSISGASASSRPLTTAGNPQRRKTYSKPSMAGASSRPSSQFGRRQTQVPHGGSRPSGGRSSMYGQGVSQLKKDPRPLSEKSYQAASIRKLIAFLSEKNYPKTFTPKSLQTPTCKEFLYILNFLLEIIDDTLIVDGMNIQESIPRVLKVLGYPFTVSKNHLLNVGSPHSWPILLGALTWLVDVCTIPDRTSEIMFGHNQQDFSDENEDGLMAAENEYKIMEVMYLTYMEYGKDSDEYRRLEEGRLDTARSQVEQYQKAVDKTKQDNLQLSEVIEELSRSSIPALQEQLKHLQTEHEQIQDALNSDLLPAIEQVNADCVESDAAASETDMQIEACKQKAKELEEQIRQQPMTSKEVQETHQRVKENYEMLDKYRAMVDDWNHQVSELQMTHNRSVSVIDSECSQGNDQLRRLAVVLPDVASLSPLDYDTSKRADPEVLQKIVQHAKSLRHELMVLHQRVASNCADLENKQINGEATMSTLQSEQVKKSLEIENIQHTLNIEKEALENKKKTFEDAMKTEQTEKHALEKQLVALQQRVQEESDAQREYAAVKKQLELEQATIEKELGEKDKLYMEYFMAVTDLFETVQLHQQAMQNGVEQLVVEYKKLKVPTVDPYYLAPRKTDIEKEYTQTVH